MNVIWAEIDLTDRVTHAKSDATQNPGRRIWSRVRQGNKECYRLSRGFVLSDIRYWDSEIGGWGGGARNNIIWWEISF